MQVRQRVYGVIWVAVKETATQRFMKFHGWHEVGRL